SCPQFRRILSRPSGLPSREPLHRLGTKRLPATRGVLGYVRRGQQGPRDGARGQRLRKNGERRIRSWRAAFGLGLGGRDLCPAMTSEGGSERRPPRTRTRPLYRVG